MGRSTNIKIGSNAQELKLPASASSHAGQASMTALGLMVMHGKNAAAGMAELTTLAGASLESWGIYFKDLTNGKSTEEASTRSNSYLYKSVEKIRENYNENSVLGKDSELRKKSDWGLLGLSIGALPDVVSTPVIMIMNIAAIESSRLALNSLGVRNLSFEEYLRQEDQDPLLRTLRVTRNISILALLSGLGGGLKLTAAMSGFGVIGEKLISLGKELDNGTAQKSTYQLNDFVSQLVNGTIAEEILQSMVSSRGFCLFSSLALGRMAAGTYDGVDSLKDLIQAGIKGEDVGYGAGALDALTVLRAIGQGCLITSALFDVVDFKDSHSREKLTEATKALEKILLERINEEEKEERGNRGRATEVSEESNERGESKRRQKSICHCEGAERPKQSNRNGIQIPIAIPDLEILQLDAKKLGNFFYDQVRLNNVTGYIRTSSNQQAIYIIGDNLLREIALLDYTEKLCLEKHGRMTKLVDEEELKKLRIEAEKDFKGLTISGYRLLDNRILVRPIDITQDRSARLKGVQDIVHELEERRISILEPNLNPREAEVKARLAELRFKEKAETGKLPIDWEIRKPILRQEILAQLPSVYSKHSFITAAKTETTRDPISQLKLMSSFHFRALNEINRALSFLSGDDVELIVEGLFKLEILEQIGFFKQSKITAGQFKAIQIITKSCLDRISLDKATSQDYQILKVFSELGWFERFDNSSEIKSTIDAFLNILLQSYCEHPAKKPFCASGLVAILESGLLQRFDLDFRKEVFSKLLQATHTQYGVAQDSYEQFLATLEESLKIFKKKAYLSDEIMQEQVQEFIKPLLNSDGPFLASNMYSLAALANAGFFANSDRHFISQLYFINRIYCFRWKDESIDYHLGFAIHRHLESLIKSNLITCQDLLGGSILEILLFEPDTTSQIQRRYFFEGLIVAIEKGFLDDIDESRLKKVISTFQGYLNSFDKGVSIAALNGFKSFVKRGLLSKVNDNFAANLVKSCCDSLKKDSDNSQYSECVLVLGKEGLLPRLLLPEELKELTSNQEELISEIKSYDPERGFPWLNYLANIVLFLDIDSVVIRSLCERLLVGIRSENEDVRTTSLSALKNIVDNSSVEVLGQELITEISSEFRRGFCNHINSDDYAAGLKILVDKKLVDLQEMQASLLPDLINFIDIAFKRSGDLNFLNLGKKIALINQLFSEFRELQSQLLACNKEVPEVAALQQVFRDFNENEELLSPFLDSLADIYIFWSKTRGSKTSDFEELKRILLNKDRWKEFPFTEFFKYLLLYNKFNIYLIKLDDNGLFVDDYSQCRLMQQLLSLPTEIRFDTNNDFPKRDKEFDPSKVDTLSVDPELESIIRQDRNPRRLGRTLVYSQGNKKIAVKLMNFIEDVDALPFEHDVMNFMNSKKEDWKLESTYPRGRHRLIKIPTADFSYGGVISKDGQIKADNHDISLACENGYYYAMVYEIEDENYFTYLNDLDLSHSEFEEGLARNLHDRIAMFQRGIYDSEIIELFHAMHDRRRYLWCIQCLNSGNAPGELEDIPKISLYPNPRLSGVSDLAAVHQLDPNFFIDPHLAATMAGHMREEYKLVNSYRYSYALLVGNMLLSHVVVLLSYLKRKGELNYEHERSNENTFFQQQLAKIFDMSHFGEVSPELSSFSMADIKLMAEQLSFYAMGEYDRQQIPQHFYPGASIEFSRFGRTYTTGRGHDVSRSKYILPSRTRKSGVEVDPKLNERSYDLGADTAVFPVTKLINWLYIWSSLFTVHVTTGQQNKEHS